MMDHIVLNVEDEERMIAFYSEVFQWPPERLEEYRKGDAPFPSLRVNADTIIDLFPRKLWSGGTDPGQGRSNLNHFCIAMSKESWDDVAGRLRVHNIEIEEGPEQRWGAHGVGTSIYFRDPEGNLIEARYY
jgi:catechol 2,3-dioxygenase-like lactoylglutathione lyase family enzyme